MKVLLTSADLTPQAIADRLTVLVGAALNDRSALCVMGDKLEIINDGQYWEFN
jgi:hypothetical protein